MRQQQRHYVRNALHQLPTIDPDRWADTLSEMSATLAQVEDCFQHHCLQCGAHADSTCVLTGGDAKCLYLQQLEPEA